MFKLLFEVCLDVKVVLLVVPSEAGVSDWAVVVQAVTQIVPICNRNGMLRHPLGGAVIFILLRHLITPSLKLRPCLSACLVFLIIMALFNKMDSRREVKFTSSA